MISRCTSLICPAIDRGTPRNTVEIYDPANGGFSAAGTMSTGRWHCTATTLPSGLVLIAGGFNGTTALNTALLYNP